MICGAKTADVSHVALVTSVSMLALATVVMMARMRMGYRQASAAVGRCRRGCNMLVLCYSVTWHHAIATAAHSPATIGVIF
jgi:hypothetical protein